MKLSSDSKNVSGLAFTICVLGAVFYCYEYYLRVAPSVMGAELKMTFNLSEAGFGHLAACYYYAYTPMQIPVGMLLDRFGIRKILTLACFLCAIGTYFFAATSILTVAEISRFLIGFGSAFAYVGVLKISDVWLPKKYFALMAGLTTALGMIGAMTGKLSMAYFVEQFGWQLTLYFAALLGMVLTLILWLVLRDEKGNQDLKKSAGLKQNADLKQNEDLQIKHSLQSQETTLWQSLILMVKNKTMWLIGLIGCFTFLPISAFAELWDVRFLETLGFDKSVSAYASSMLFLGFAVGGPLFGLFSDKIKSRRIPLVLGSFISAILMFLIIFIPNISFAWMAVLLFFMSFAASAEILVFAIASDITRKEVVATAVAFTNMLVMAGGLASQPLIGKILDYYSKIVDGLPSNTPADYQIALLVLPLGLILAGILSLLLKESYNNPNREL